MVTRQAIFKYKTKKGPLHKAPAAVKLVLFLPVSVFCLLLPSFYLAAGIIIAFSFSLFCSITLREQLTDLKPALFYIIFMYILSLINNILNHSPLLIIIAPNLVFLNAALRLFFIIQLSALLFRTTSPLEIHNIVRIEIVSLFLMFIPEIFKTWEMINLAWKARGGRKGINRIKSLVFTLIAMSFKTASVKAKALASRRV